MLVFLRVHILADVTSLSVTPSSAGLNVLEEHCMPDQDRIPHASIHHNFVICNSFVRQIIDRFDFSTFFMCIIHMRQPFFVGRKHVVEPPRKTLYFSGGERDCPVSRFLSVKKNGKV